MYDYYQILNIPSTATHPEIKLAYHSLLFKYHPDKRKHVNPTTNTLLRHYPNDQNNRIVPSSQSPESSEVFDIALLKEAYTTLSSPLSRSLYDLSLKNHQHRSNSKSTTTGPRPAQVVSLEDFDSAEHEDVWKYQCRCGGNYIISESDMENGQHLVGCNSCSEVIWVGYELADGDDHDVEGAAH